MVFLGLVASQALRILYNAFYNLFLHPLSRFRGPVTWIAFPVLKNVAQIRGQADHDVVALHEKLGSVVRIAPNTLSFTTTTAWKDIYGTGHAELPKDIVKGSGMEERPNIITSNPRDHHRFRKAMIPAFSNDALSRQEPLINGYVDTLVQRMREISLSKNPVADVSTWFTMTTFDIFGDLCYGESFNGLASGKQHPWTKAIGDTKFLIPLLVFPGISWLLVLLLVPKKQRASLAEHQQLSYDLTMKRITNKDRHLRGDFMTFMMRSQAEDHGLTDHELASNSDIVINAGSETTATALTGITYFLTRTPKALKRVTREVREAFDSQEAICFKDATSKLPYLMGCIEEGLRLYPPVPTALVRRTLPGRPTLIDGHLIPENTTVAVHHLATYLSENNFHDAKSFHPQRWLAEEHSDPNSPFHNDNRDCHRPFSYGPRNCIGRNLAYHELRLILAKILWNFDLSLAPGYEKWGEKQRTFQLWEKPKLMVQFKERQKTY